jgi:glycosyltransferase involved in cell wall biosynthesis
VTPLSVVLVGSSPWSADLADDDLDLRTALALAGRLRGGFDVIVPCGAAAPGQVNRGAVRLHRVPATARLAFLLAARRTVDRVIASWSAGEPQVLMSSDPLAAVVLESSSARRRHPHIVQIQGEIIAPGPEYGSRLKRGAIAAATRSALRRASGVRVVSESLRARVQPMVKCPLAVVGSRVDTRVFTPGPSASVTTAKADAVMVGSLLDVKNHSTVLHAWSQIMGDVPGARLLIVGEGRCRPRLEDLIASLDLREHVTLQGEVAHRGIPDLLRMARCLLHPSWSEGQPRAVLEGMACGLPVICSDIPAHREIVPATAGCLVPTGDVDGWAETIARVLRDPAGAADMGRRGRAHVMARHDFDVSIDRYAEFIRSVAVGA